MPTPTPTTPATSAATGFTAGGKRYELCTAFTLQQDAHLRQALERATFAAPTTIPTADPLPTLTALMDAALTSGELATICGILAAPVGQKWTPAAAAAAAEAIESTTIAAEKASILDFFAAALSFFLGSGALGWTLSTPLSPEATQPPQ